MILIFNKLICKLRGHTYINKVISSRYGMAKVPVCSRCNDNDDVYQELKEYAEELERDMSEARAAEKIAEIRREMCDPVKMAEFKKALEAECRRISSSADNAAKSETSKHKRYYKVDSSGLYEISEDEYARLREGRNIICLEDSQEAMVAYHSEAMKPRPHHPAMQRNMTNEDRVNLGISEGAQRRGDIELARYLYANIATKPSDYPSGELLDWNYMLDCQKAQLEQENPMYADYLKQKANVK